jgi:hypothetical protein
VLCTPANTKALQIGITRGFWKLKHLFPEEVNMKLNSMNRLNAFPYIYKVDYVYSPVLLGRRQSN